MSSHPLYRQHHTHSLYDITLAKRVALFALYKTSHPHFMTSSHHLYIITPTIFDIISTVSVSSHQVYWWYHSHYMHDIISSICETSCPLYLRHRTHMYDNTMWVNYTTLGIYMTSFVLQKTSHPLYHTKPQSLWLHIHFSHDITPPVSDIAPTVSLSSQPLHWYHTHFCMTSHPLYVWHLMHKV